MQWNTDTDEGRIPVLWWLGGSSDTESQSKQFEAGIANACNTVVREADKKKLSWGVASGGMSEFQKSKLEFFVQIQNNKNSSLVFKFTLYNNNTTYLIYVEYPPSENCSHLRF